MRNLISYISWTGAVALATASPNIDMELGKFQAIIGLTLLTIQAIDNRAYNLIALNLVSIGGFLHAIYF